MAEIILSPGVFQIESDQSLYTQAPPALGAAIVGPTVGGRQFGPTYVTTYTQYQSIFGDVFKSGSYYYEYFTSQAARHYSQNGGQTLLVTRISSGSSNISTYATSNIPSVTLATTSSVTVSSASLAPFITPTGSFSINGITIAITGSVPPANTATTMFVASGSTPANTVTAIVTAFNASSSATSYSSFWQQEPYTS